MLSPEEYAALPPARTTVDQAWRDTELAEWYGSPLMDRLAHVHPMPNLEGCSVIEQTLIRIGIFNDRAAHAGREGWYDVMRTINASVAGLWASLPATDPRPVQER